MGFGSPKLRGFSETHNSNKSFIIGGLTQALKLSIGLPQALELTASFQAVNLKHAAKNRWQASHIMRRTRRS